MPAAEGRRFKESAPAAARGPLSSTATVSSPVKILHRKLLLGFLVAAFMAQTWMVYTDEVAEGSPRLDARGLHGRTLWTGNNCNACHQLHGFGGFLGPDLTNAMSRLGRERLDQILTVGAGQMPAFHMSPEEIDAIAAFLTAVDQTGRGQARRFPGLSREQVGRILDEQARVTPLDAEARAGHDRFRQVCSSCHVLFQRTPLGPFVAPDLLRAAGRLDRAVLDDLLVSGRPERGMPPSGLDAEQRQELVRFLQWLDRHGAALAGAAAGRSGADLGIPWFEFR